MKLIPAGRFAMGSDDHYLDERPVRLVDIDAFWIDEVPVTNSQFAAFVEATGYVTYAEIAPRVEDYPGMDPALAVAGSLVFTPPNHPVATSDAAQWWSYAPDACWRRPWGASSDLAGLEDHPVAHVVARDAEAYAQWAGKRLPTEAEWERAARGGLEGKTFAWGDQLEPGGRPQAKIWAGVFPWRNDAPAGLQRTSPVRAYPANGFGLYDMIGNVWEWTADTYLAGEAVKPACCSAGKSQTLGAQLSIDPLAPSHTSRRVAKGGSHLCAPNWCQRYRPAARWGQPVDTSTSHMGFRCAASA
ncbi:formylglycine-generating enzyme family protein [Caulobacter sp. NIBR2454]|uniref:formylglycine-generating enzyme family protein n=1 Tax=Caulobacter sp. NIBR2454 TaxID=3015996 RepID=UPI0022B705D5|nr:formylglycine-generating enzyme family protein [Caulobacter sp. NIBR2454]